MLNTWKRSNLQTKLAVYKIHPILIVLLPCEYYFTFNTKKINMVHVDDNLVSPQTQEFFCSQLQADDRIRLKKPKHPDQEKSDMF